MFWEWERKEERKILLTQNGLDVIQQNSNNNNFFLFTAIQHDELKIFKTISQNFFVGTWLSLEE